MSLAGLEAIGWPHAAQCFSKGHNEVKAATGNESEGEGGELFTGGAKLAAKFAGLVAIERLYLTMNTSETVAENGVAGVTVRFFVRRDDALALGRMGAETRDIAAAARTAKWSPSNPDALTGRSSYDS